MENVLIKHLADSEVEITAEIPAQDFDDYRPKALKSLGQEVEISGFRKGHVPESILAQKIGEHAILEEMAQHAVAHVYPKLIAEKKIEAIGRPQIMITKIAQGNPLAFKITTAVLPVVELPDYKIIAQGVMDKKEEVTEVVEKEVEDTLNTLRKNWAQAEAARNTKEGENTPTGDLPEANDEFARKVGDFKNLGELRGKIKENLAEEKKQQAREKKRIEIIDSILEKTKISLPKILIETEKNKMLVQFKDNIAMMGLKPESYFEQIKKTEEEIKNGWSDEAVKRVKIQFILHKIAKLEHIMVPEEGLAKEVSHLLEHYAGADPERARSYAEEIMRNDLVWKFLEGNKPDSTQANTK